ncbi:MAG: ATP-binding protein [Gammaproteobacteria bacterium]|nr:ATP-binding protein [Gammaproteobacteria bacterium]
MRKFNPGLLQTDEEIAAQFVVRHNEFRTLCEVVRGNMNTPSCQHVLVVGSRGQGKTMLLTRLAAEVRTDSEFSRHFLPVQFMEENQEVDSLADFWMETLFNLAQEFATSDVALHNELNEKHESLTSRWAEQGFEELARSAVLEVADRIGRRLVLLVENVQSLFAELDEDFGWGLRAILQSMPQITLVATATNRFDALDDPRAPFFELFRLVTLNPLNTDECGRLWSMVSKAESKEHEIRPLEILTGGNPRLIVVVAEFARHRSLSQLMEELVNLVDEHTDYFRSQLDVLPKQERRVFIALIDLWHASSTSEIAARARLDMRVVSTMIKRLIDRGAVMIVDGDGPRNRRYAASERLFSFYYKLRRVNSETAVVESLIHFIVSFYDESQVHMLTEQIFTHALESSAIYAGIESALVNRTRAGESDLRSNWEQVANISKKVSHSVLFDERLRLIDALVLAGEGKNWDELLEITQRYVSDGFLSKGSRHDHDVNWALISCARSDAFIGLRNFDHAIVVGEEAEVRLNDAIDMTSIQGLRRIKFNQVWAHFELGDYVRVRTESEKFVRRYSEFDETEIASQVAFAHVLEADANERLGDLTAAITLLDKFLQSCDEGYDEELEHLIALALFRKSKLLGSIGGNFYRAIESFDAFLNRFDGTEDEWIRGYLIAAKRYQGVNHGMVGDFNQEIANFQSVLDSVRDGDPPFLKSCFFIALLQKGRRLAELGRPRNALSCCDDAQRWLARNPDMSVRATSLGLNWFTNCTRALALMYAGDVEAALNSLREAYEAFDIERRSDFEEIMRLIPELLAAGAEAQDLIDVLQSNENNAWDLLPMTIALQRRIGAPVIAPGEAIEVAKDLEKCIEYRLERGLQPGYFLRSGYD